MAREDLLEEILKQLVELRAELADLNREFARVRRRLESQAKTAKPRRPGPARKGPSKRQQR